VGLSHIARAWVVLMKRLGTRSSWRKAAIGAQSSPNKWVCLRLRSCSAFTPTCLACFRTTSTTRLFPGRRRHRVSQPTRNSLTSVCSSSIKRVSATVTRWDCAADVVRNRGFTRRPGGLFP
jgi:hypothetical protein